MNDGVRGDPTTAAPVRLSSCSFGLKRRSDRGRLVCGVVGYKDTTLHEGEQEVCEMCGLIKRAGDTPSGECRLECLPTLLDTSCHTNPDSVGWTCRGKRGLRVTRFR